jgi:hypothetical protein
MKYIVFHFAFFMIFSLTAAAQNYFVNNYGIAGYGNRSLLTNDRAIFYVAGEDGAISVMKIDSGGNILWQNRVDFHIVQSLFLVTGVAQTTDDGFLVLIWSNPNSGSRSQLIVKFDANGNFSWTRHFNTNTQLWNGIIANANNGFMISGGDWVIRFDSIGSIIWQKSYGPGALFINTIGAIATRDYINYLFAGRNDQNMLLFEIDTMGYTNWEKLLVTSCNSLLPQSMKPTMDGGYIITGGCDCDPNHVPGYFLAKINSSGSPEWLSANLRGDQAEGNDVVELTDSSFVMVGNGTEFGADNCLFVNADKHGNIQSVQYDNSSTSSDYYSVQLFNPSTLAICGYLDGSTLSFIDPNFLTSCDPYPLAGPTLNSTLTDSIINTTPSPSFFGIDSIPVTVQTPNWLCSNMCHNSLPLAISKFENYTLSIYPNPLTQTSILETNSYLDDATIILYNSSGQIIWFKGQLSGNKFEINKDNLQTGIYQIRLLQKERIIGSMRILIQ